MTIYPTGQRVTWRADIPPRRGTQTGALSQPWHCYAEFPWVRWDGEQEGQQELPECVALASKQASVSVRDAWATERRVTR